MNDNISRQVAHQIVEFAISQNVDVIVFECLNTKGKNIARKLSGLPYGVKDKSKR